jgi:uncharacterized RDD family membrane protein YckC
MGRANFGQRLGAFIIDMLISNVASGILGAIAGVILAVTAVNEDLIGWIGALIGLIVAWIYFITVPTMTKGQTLGKKLLKIRVQHIDGIRLSQWRFFIREFVGKTISFIILLIGFFMALGKEKRALHDYLAKTIVVND